MIDLKTYSAGGLALFRDVCKAQFDDPMPLSAAEEQLAEWSHTQNEIFEGKKLSSDAINNISLIMATWFRNFGRERLSGIEETNDGLVLKLDFAHVSGLVGCNLELSKAEVKEILQDPLPFKKANKITDTRIQIAISGKIASLDLAAVVGENPRVGTDNIQRAKL